MQKKPTHPGKKAQKAFQPKKKKKIHRKSTRVLLKAVATIPDKVALQSRWLPKTMAINDSFYCIVFRNVKSSPLPSKIRTVGKITMLASPSNVK